MNTKEAIAILTHNWKYRELIDNSYQYEALEVAIKALEVVDKIKKAYEDDEYPEYLQEDIQDILREFYGKDKL